MVSNPSTASGFGYEQQPARSLISVSVDQKLVFSYKSRTEINKISSEKKIR